jgi:hypothetical protein
MALRLEGIADENHVSVELLGGRFLYTWSGTALTTFRGTGPQWMRDSLSIDQEIPMLPPNKTLGPPEAPAVRFASINTAATGGAPDAGWAVDSTDWGKLGRDRVRITFHLAVFGQNAHLLRVGYIVQVVARLEDA